MPYMSLCLLAGIMERLCYNFVVVVLSCHQICGAVITMKTMLIFIEYAKSSSCCVFLITLKWASTAHQKVRWKKFAFWKFYKYLKKPCGAFDHLWRCGAMFLRVGIPVLFVSCTPTAMHMWELVGTMTHIPDACFILAAVTHKITRSAAMCQERKWRRRRLACKHGSKQCRI